MQLRGAIIIVTGGGTGIGRAAALKFAEKGSSVIVCGRRRKPLTETVELIKQKGGEALAIPADVRIQAEVTAMVDIALERFGKIDVLVNNAGVAVIKSVMDTTEEEWDETLDTDLKGVFLCCKAVLPGMIKAQNGVIINVSSALGKVGVPNLGAYCASKFGVIGFTQALAKELQLQAIRVYAVCPGATYTPLHSRLVGEESAKTAMPPEKVAEKIVGLAAGEVSLPSGASIAVDEQLGCPVLREAKGGWRHAARRWLKSVKGNLL